MSKFDPQTFACPRCGREFLAGTAESINFTRMPRARERLLDGSFHRFPCEHCGTVITIDRVFTCVDLRREQFLHVFPLDHEKDWPKWEEIAGETFWNAFGSGPPMVQALGPRYRVRAVFGLDAAADKLRLWDAGLDDAIVELQKLELFAGAPELRERGDAVIDVVDVNERHIEVAVRSAGGTFAPMAFALSRARYQELEASRDQLVPRYPGLFHKPYVGFRRLARETVAPTAESAGAISEPGRQGGRS